MLTNERETPTWTDDFEADFEAEFEASFEKKQTNKQKMLLEPKWLLRGLGGLVVTFWVPSGSENR